MPSAKQSPKPHFGLSLKLSSPKPGEPRESYPVKDLQKGLYDVNDKSPKDSRAGRNFEGQVNISPDLEEVR